MSSSATPTPRYGFVLVFVLSLSFSCQNFSPLEKRDKPTGGAQATEKTIPTHAPSDNSAVCQIIHRSTAAMGTLFDFTLCVSQNTPEVERAVKDAFAEVRRIDGLMTSYRPDSHVSRINEYAGKKGISVPLELYNLIEQSMSISRKTKGKFDITFASIGRIWNFRTDQPSLPERKEIRKRIRLIDYRKVITDPKRNMVKLKDRRMRIGLGAIAKGYAVDRAGEVLRAHGISNYIVYGGGDLLIGGSKNGAPWKIGIQDPRDKARYFAKLSLRGDKAIVTSGDYEKYFVIAGKRYHHILDPDTGFPATGSSSVTIVTDSAAVADAMATGVFVLGPREGMALIESEPELEGIIVDSSLRPHVSAGLRSEVELTEISVTQKGQP